MIAILCTDGAMDLRDILRESANKWVPILVYLDKGETVVVTFDNEDTAKRFAKRNIKKGWLLGAVYLGDDGVQYVNSQGWKIEVLDWPKRIPNFTFEVINFSTAPEVYTSNSKIWNI